MRRVRIVLVALFLSAMAFAQAPQDPNSLVQTMVQNELKARKDDHSHWMYLDSMTEDSTTKVNEVVETPSGTLQLLVAENGLPLSEQQKARQMAKLNKSALDASSLRQEKRATSDDSRKATEMLQMLPDAFLYTIVGDSGESVHLRFRPNPDFDPPSREAMVFHAMAGDMMIDKKEGRLAELSGQLMSNVYFGWGLLGKLMQGGTFRIEQKEVGPKHWELILLDVHITGKALLFKSIQEQQHETRTEYRRVPDDLSPEQAVAMLLNPAEQLPYNSAQR